MKAACALPPTIPVQFQLMKFKGERWELLGDAIDGGIK
jgi:hypothetical protein